MKKLLGFSSAILLLASGLVQANDPLEPVNRFDHQLNTDMDTMAITPVAAGYHDITPSVVDDGITNFFDNLADVPSAANNLLQGKPGRSLSDVGRVIINTTIGLGGLFDVASKVGLPSYKEDFGQTMGVWGIPSGPYLNLPFAGPTSLRDLVGTIGDGYIHPVHFLHPAHDRVAVYGLQYLDHRGDTLNETAALNRSAVDSYIFLRETYLQKRENLVDDGQTTTILGEDF